MSKKNYRNRSWDNNNNKQLRSRAAQEKTLYWWRWIDHIEELYYGRFIWENLPDTVDERYIELLLLRKGCALFFEDVAGEVRVAQPVTQGPPDLYENFNSYSAMGANGYYFEVANGEGVIGYNSLTRRNIYPNLDLFAHELAEIEELARINRRQQRNLAIITGSEGQTADLVQMKKDYQMGEEVIVALKGIGDDIELNVLNTNVPYLQDAFNQDRTSVLNRLYASLGIEHIPFEKGERLVTGEASVASDAVARIREDNLLARRTAADLVNEKFGTNIQVKWRTTELDNIEMDPYAALEERGVGENE